MLQTNIEAFSGLIAPAVQAAVSPIQAQVSDLGQKLEYLERRINATGSQDKWHEYGWTNYPNDPGAWPGWQDYGEDAYMEAYDDDVFPPLQPNWAQRAAAVGGKGKGGQN